MLKKIAILGFSAFVLLGCGKTVSQQTENANISAQTSNNMAIISGHSQSQNSNGNLSAVQQQPRTSATIVPKSDAKTRWTQSGNPVDVSEFDAEIAGAQKGLKAKPKDETAKKSLAEAFVKRGVALTDARQYASALGDYRRALKLDAGNEEAKKWIEEILNIYAMLNRDYPKEGEEPPPLPFKKQV
jgi:tetratricopeptide (TPR) repeat protein